MSEEIDFLEFPGYVAAIPAIITAALLVCPFLIFSALVSPPNQ